MYWKGEKERERETGRESERVCTADHKVVRPRKTTIPMVPNFGGATLALSRVCVSQRAGRVVWSVAVECEGCGTESNDVEKRV